RLRQAADADEPAEHAGGVGVRDQVADLGGRPAGEPQPDPGGEGPRGLAGPLPRQRRRRGGRGRPGVATPPDPELRGPERGRDGRRGGGEAAGGRTQEPSRIILWWDR